MSQQICTVKCPLCGNWMNRTTSKRGQPVLKCSLCRYTILLLKKSAIETLDKVCKVITEPKPLS